MTDIYAGLRERAARWEESNAKRVAAELEKQRQEQMAQDELEGQQLTELLNLLGISATAASGEIVLPDGVRIEMMEYSDDPHRSTWTRGEYPARYAILYVSHVGIEDDDEEGEVRHFYHLLGTKAEPLVLTDTEAWGKHAAMFVKRLDSYQVIWQRVLNGESVEEAKPQTPAPVQYVLPIKQLTESVYMLPSGTVFNLNNVSFVPKKGGERVALWMGGEKVAELDETDTATLRAFFATKEKVIHLDPNDPDYIPF